MAGVERSRRDRGAHRRVARLIKRYKTETNPHPGYFAVILAVVLAADAFGFVLSLRSLCHGFFIRRSSGATDLLIGAPLPAYPIVALQCLAY